MGGLFSTDFLEEHFKPGWTIHQLKGRSKIIRATSLEDGKEYYLKLFLFRETPGFELEDALLETQDMRKLVHPNLVRCLNTYANDKQLLI